MLDRLAGLRAVTGGRDGVRSGFSARAWEDAYRRVVARAFGEVPFYREQWAAAGRVLPEPAPVHSHELVDQLFRLCPLNNPFQPAREPSLWIADPRGLRTAVRLATGAGRGTGLLEVRGAMLDARAGGTRYAVVLPRGAETAGEGRRRSLNRPAALLAARTGRAVVVGGRPELAEVVPELRAAMPAARAELLEVVRATLGQAAGDGGAPLLVHDPCLGYFAARVPGCGRVHLLWRDYHARAEGGSLLVTALRRRRPTLVNVIPADPGTVVLRFCPEHESPILKSADAE